MVTKYSLKNKMKVLYVPTYKSPVVSVQVWVRTGSADEGKGEEGLSHFIEHLVFKGTDSYGPGEIAHLVEARGGELNAYTSFDQTVFHVTISSHFAETAFSVLSEMIGSPKFEATEVDREREVVIEEIKMGLDSPSRVASQLLFSTAYQKSRYRNPVIGFEKNIREVTVKKLKSFFYHHYHPERMFLVIAGALYKKDQKALAEKYFGRIKGVGKPYRAARPKEGALKKLRVRVKLTEFQQTSAYLAWPIPASSHRDIPALDVLAYLLGQTETSRLVQALRLKKPLTQSIGAGSFLGIEPGQFLISFKCEEQNLTQVFTEIAQVLAFVQGQGFEANELSRALLNLQTDEVFSIETVDGLARKFGFFEFLYKDPNRLNKYFENLRKVSLEDLLRVAKKYLDPKKLTASVMGKKSLDFSEKKFVQVFCVPFQQALKGQQELKKQKATAKKSTEIKVKTKKVPNKVFKFSLKNSLKFSLEEIALSNGHRLIIKRSKEVPVISVRGGVLGGSLLEKESNKGLSYFLSQVFLSGTKNKTELEIFTEMEKSSARLTALSGRNSFSIGLDQVTPFQQKGLNLLAEFISSAHFRDEVITREKTVLLEQLKQKRDSPSRVLMEEVHQKVFGTHPYGFELTGDEATIPKFTNVDLDVLWGEYQKRPWAWILVGDFKEDLWLEFFEKLPKVSSNYWVAPQPKIQVHKDMDHKKFLEKNQTHLAIVYPFSGAMTELQRLQHEILESVLAGQGGRLFVELRDKESLAYSVSPIRMEGLVGGYFGAYIACSPDKVEKAKVMMIDEFKKVVESGITETELERAKTYLIGRHDIQLQRLASLSSSLLYEALYGYSLEKLFDYAPTLAPIKASQIKTLGQEIFSRPCLMVEVGP